MNTDEMFLRGVTPVDGTLAGKRFRVLSIMEDKVSVAAWNDPSERMTIRHGAYKLWSPPTTVLDDPGKVVTWGELKKAVEQAKLPDDTQIYVRWMFGLYDATVVMGQVNKKKALIFH